MATNYKANIADYFLPGLYEEADKRKKAKEKKGKKKKERNKEKVRYIFCTPSLLLMVFQ